MICRHCQKRNANRSRGLCWHCYYTPGVRALYPAHAKNGRPTGEPTEAELDRMIAEQMKCLPEWWKSDTPTIEGLSR